MSSRRTLSSQIQRRLLERWSRVHAAAMLAGCAISLATGRSWPLALVAAASFVSLIEQNRGAWTPRGGFGFPNLVTALRLGVSLAIACGFGELPSLAFAAVVLALLLLDGVDGWLARRGGSASAFGAQFDMEVDALMVLIVELALWEKGGFGAWILITGLLRYVYVLCLALLPARNGAQPRSRIARYAFSALVVGLIAAVALPGAAVTWAAAIGTALVSASFARGLHWSYRGPKARDTSAPSLPGVAPGR